MAGPNKSPRLDLYAKVTGQIVSELERGVTPWTKPWSAEHLAGHVSRPLRHNQRPYSGMNVLLLWSRAVSSGYRAPVWMTFRQALELGAHVRKAEVGTMVVYASAFSKNEQDDEGRISERKIPFLKTYTVFNVEQIEGLAAAYHAPMEVLEPDRRIERAERFFAATGADIRHGGAEAYYALQLDRVQLPPFEAFRDPESYYATLAHECTHWTRHPSRLDRDFGRKRFGDEGYAKEELVAELGAAFLCADLGLELTPRPDHAAYIASWLQALRGDQRLIFTAATHAQRAVDYLAALQTAGA
jgi:antirestriction protein ArdC